jgi:hypothetical protein
MTLQEETVESNLLNAKTGVVHAPMTARRAVCHVEVFARSTSRPVTCKACLAVLALK